MAENSAISWTDHTFNPWVGCTKVSPACDGCYAEALVAGRFGRVVWGASGKGEGTRDRTAPSTWRLPRKWNKQAASTPGRTFVFCASLADVFDNAVPVEWRRDLFELIEATPNLTYLLLTKRPGNIVKLFAETLGTHPGKEGLDTMWPRNAAIGCTVVTQEEADRDIPKLLTAKRALNPAFTFLSMEPLLGPVDLTRVRVGGPRDLANVLNGDLPAVAPGYPDYVSTNKVDWVITGGETDQGSHVARPADPDWYRSLRDQCAAAGVPFHFKQWGEWVGLGQASTLTKFKPGVTTIQFHDFGHPHEIRRVQRCGKDMDPGTLDGVLHHARPEARR